ncbi:MAG TPA: hypothetical protein PLB45_02890 [Bacilli bacterium]|jgi:hypothetical protein|nr:hypothetical protein [Bacilli bacterium]
MIDDFYDMVRSLLGMCGIIPSIYATPGFNEAAYKEFEIKKMQEFWPNIYDEKSLIDFYGFLIDRMPELEPIKKYYPDKIHDKEFLYKLRELLYENDYRQFKNLVDSYNRNLVINKKTRS